MAWTTPVDWTVGQVLTAADINKINANLNALKTPPTVFVKGDGAANFTTTSTTFEAINALTLSSALFTTTGGDVMIGVSGTVTVAVGQNITLDFEVDGVRQGAYSGAGGLIHALNSSANGGVIIVPIGTVTLVRGLVAGSHTIKLVWKVSTGTATLYNSATAIPTFWAREV